MDRVGPGVVGEHVDDVGAPSRAQAQHADRSVRRARRRARPGGTSWTTARRGRSGDPSTSYARCQRTQCDSVGAGRRGRRRSGSRYRRRRRRGRRSGPGRYSPDVIPVRRSAAVGRSRARRGGGPGRGTRRRARRRWCTVPAIDRRDRDPRRDPGAQRAARVGAEGRHGAVPAPGGRFRIDGVVFVTGRHDVAIDGAGFHARGARPTASARRCPGTTSGRTGRDLRQHVRIEDSTGDHGPRSHRGRVRTPPGVFKAPRSKARPGSRSPARSDVTLDHVTARATYGDGVYVDRPQHGRTGPGLHARPQRSAGGRGRRRRGHHRRALLDRRPRPLRVRPRAGARRGPSGARPGQPGPRRQELPARGRRRRRERR